MNNPNSGVPTPAQPAYSLRQRLLLGILLPVGVLLALNALVVHQQALAAADTAYDRTLLASAKAIGETLDVGGTLQSPQLVATVPYSALEAFEADNRSRMVFKVTGFSDELVAGFADLPRWQGRIPDRGIYSALVDFYDARYKGEPVRVAVLLQPVAGQLGQGMATIQVAETLELRHALARQMLQSTLWRQSVLLLLIGGVVLWVVQRVTAPVRELSRHIETRPDGELSPIEPMALPAELKPLVEATNQAFARVRDLLAHQKRFVRDVSHQLRTPLAVLKAQVQSAQRGDLPPQQALADIEQTVQGATLLANQMLALAKVEQLRQQGEAEVFDFEPIVRSVALDLAPLVAAKGIDFSLASCSALVRAHEWGLRELVRNLLHNAIKFSPEGAALTLRLAANGAEVVLEVADQGPGLSAAQRQRLFQPFAPGEPGGAGLGLAICLEVTRAAGGRIELHNTEGAGLLARVVLPGGADNLAP